MPNDLVTVIKQKQTAIAQLEAELAEARALLMGEPRPKPQIARQLEPPTTATTRKRRKAQHSRRWPRRAGIKAARGEIVPTSSVGLTVEVLRRAGKPLPIAEIVREIEAHGHKVHKPTIFGNLSRYLKLKRVFYRPSPGVYGLLELKKGA